MHNSLHAFHVLVLCMTAYAQSASEKAITLMPPKGGITIPTSVDAEPGEAATITAVCDGKVKWSVWPGLTEGRHYYIDKTAKTIIIWKPGRYSVKAWTAVDNEPIPSEICKVTIEDSGPDPGPDPNPETLADRMATAFRKDKAAGTGTEADKAALIDNHKTVINLMATAKTYFGLLDTLAALNEARVPPGKLPTVKKVLREYMSKTLPDKDGPITPELSAKIKAAFEEANKAMEAAK